MALTALVLAGLAFLLSIASLAITWRDGRQAWRDWEQWAAMHRASLKEVIDKAFLYELEDAFKRIGGRMDETIDLVRRAEAQAGATKSLLKRAEERADGPPAAAQDAGVPQFPLPQQLGVTPEEMAGGVATFAANERGEAPPQQSRRKRNPGLKPNGAGA